MLLLRPHHALCIQKFTGHGYDPAFTAHMTCVTAALRDDPETPVRLTPGGDELCGHCPHYRDGACDSQAKAARMDGAVLALTGLEEGRTLPWRDLAAAARERILDAPAFHRVCSSCEWFDLCKRT